MNKSDFLCQRYQVFDLDISRALILMASLVYERDDDWVASAACDPAYASEFLLKSEEKINHIANNIWNMRFVSISDFTPSAKGAYCGIFYEYTADKAYIVLAFKGTSPANYSEWLVDASFVREDSSDFLWGSCHQGFYTNLFPSTGNASRHLPYDAITETLKMVASHIRENISAKGEPDQKIQLYVCGHSLGAALASICYSRFLKSPGDLGDDIELRDAYCYGTPRVGDGVFASNWDGCMARPDNENRNMFRISNDHDIVAKVPSGMADMRDRRASLNPQSLLNYGAFGAEMILLPERMYHFMFNTGVKSGRDIRLCQQPGQPPRFPINMGNLNNPIGMQNYFGFLYSFLYDHFPTGYYNNLQAVTPDPEPEQGRRRLPQSIMFHGYANEAPTRQERAADVFRQITGDTSVTAF